MQDRRSSARVRVSREVRFTVTVVEGGYACALEARGRIVDLSKEGFGIETDHPLQKGHVITIRDIPDGRVPTHGLVLWSRQINGRFRAGLRPLVQENSLHMPAESPLQFNTQ